MALAGPDAIVGASEASGNGESFSQKMGKAMSSRVNSSGGGQWRISFPQNSAGHPAWIRMQIVERVAAGLSEMMSATAKTPAGQLLGTINLYMPQTITFSDGLTYDNAELTGITSALMSSANEAKNKGFISETVAAFKPLAQDFMASKTSAGSAVKAGSGVAINPRASMLFKAPTFRQLALTFKLIPSNRGDSAAIESIINYIRIHSYPELIAGGASFMFPNLFRLSFVGFGGAAPRIMPFNDAYCTGVTVNYNPTSAAFMEDGAPSEVDLTVNFQETKVLDRKGIMQSLGMETETQTGGGNASAMGPT